MPNPSSTGLYWSMRGAVYCAKHLNAVTDARRAADGWEPLPITSQAIPGRRYQCQQCAFDSVAVVHFDPHPRQHTGSRLVSRGM